MTALVVPSSPMIWIPRPRENVPSYLLAYIEEGKLFSVPFEEPDGPNNLGLYVPVPLWHRGKVAGHFVVSPDQEEWVNRWQWRLLPTSAHGSSRMYLPVGVYVVRNDSDTGRIIRLHRSLVRDRLTVLRRYADHVNHHTLDHRNLNINPATNRENNRNKGVRV